MYIHYHSSFCRGGSRIFLEMGAPLRNDVSVSVSVYYLATISYISRNKKKYIYKLIEAARRAIRLYEMDLLNPRISLTGETNKF